MRNAQKMMKRERLSMSDNKVKWITQVSDKTFFTVFKNTALITSTSYIASKFVFLFLEVYLSVIIHMILPQVSPICVKKQSSRVN